MADRVGCCIDYPRLAAGQLRLIGALLKIFGPPGTHVPGCNMPLLRGSAGEPLGTVIFRKRKINLRSG